MSARASTRLASTSCCLASSGFTSASVDLPDARTHPPSLARLVRRELRRASPTHGTLPTYLTYPTSPTYLTYLTYATYLTYPTYLCVLFDASCGGEARKGSSPGHDRHVDGPRCPLPANGLDRVVHLRQPERMRHHQLERDPVRGQLMQRELHRPIGMPARALQRHAFPCQPPDRKRGELLVAFSLHDHSRSATLR